MPFPALAAVPAILLPIAQGLRLPALAAFLATIFGQIVAFFVQFFTLRTAMQLGIITAVIGLTVGFFTAIKLLLAGITIVAPPEFEQAMSLIIPSNLPICISAIVSAHIVRWVWIWQVYVIESYASAR